MSAVFECDFFHYVLIAEGRTGQGCTQFKWQCKFMCQHLVFIARCDDEFVEFSYFFARAAQIKKTGEDEDERDVIAAFH